MVAAECMERHSGMLRPEQAQWVDACMRASTSQAPAALQVDFYIGTADSRVCHVAAAAAAARTAATPVLVDLHPKPFRAKGVAAEISKSISARAAADCNRVVVVLPAGVGAYGVTAVMAELASAGHRSPRLGNAVLCIECSQHVSSSPGSGFSSQLIARCAVPGVLTHVAVVCSKGLRPGRELSQQVQRLLHAVPNASKVLVEVDSSV